jgi:nitrate/nitrite transporter NarK
MLVTVLVTMVLSHIRQVQQGRTYVYIPAVFRDEFGITTETKVDVKKVNGKLVITFPSD